MYIYVYKPKPKVEGNCECAQSRAPHQAPLSILEWVSHFLLQGIFLTQGSNPCLLHWRVDSLSLSHLGSPGGNFFFCVASVVSDSVQPHRRQAPPSLGFSRQEHLSGLPCPPPGDLRNPGTEPEYLTSPALASGFFTASAMWEARLSELGSI